MKLQLLVSVMLFCCVYGGKLPSDYTICQHGDANALSVCLKKAVQEALVKMKDGVPSIKLPSIDPLVTPKATLGQGQGAVHVMQEYENLKIIGVSKTIVDEAKVSFTKTTFDLIIKVHADEYVVDSDYKMDGQILLIPVKGEGRAVITFVKPTTEFQVSGDILHKKGKEYLKVTHTETTLNPEKVTFKYDNLFNGDEALSKQLHIVFNENWKEIYDDLRPEFGQLISVILQNYVNNLFSVVASDDLFPKPK